MKQLSKIFIIFGFITFLSAGCTKDFDKTNISPNSPLTAPSYTLMTNVEKQIMDNMRNEWWGGRFGWLLDQNLTQNNYTSEDRYAFRENVNDSYWANIYAISSDLTEIIRLNTDPLTKVNTSAYGANANQIAAAKVLRAWVISNLTDIYGDVPFSKAWQALTVPSPAYDKQQDIYAALLTDLTDAATALTANSGDPVFTQGDMIYGGDAVKWKKFANSLKCRIALRMIPNRATVTIAGKTPLAHIQDAIASGVFTSNDDVARFTYVVADPNQAPFYRDQYVNGRRDFSVSKQFMDLLKGVNPDALGANGRDNTNPFFGLTDPRLPVFAKKSGGKYTGMPYGASDAQVKLFGRFVASEPSLVMRAVDFSCIYMDYAEVCFIQSEINGFDQTWYLKGVQASLDYWDGEYTKTFGTSLDPAAISDYVAAIPAANAENVATQKYIDLFMQAHQGWCEYRRTHFPKTIVRPNEITYTYYPKPGDPLVSVVFVPLTEPAATDLPRRMTYPQQEQTLNKANYTAAAARIGGDKLSTKVWWEGGN